MTRKLNSVIGLLMLGHLFLAIAVNAMDESVLKTQKDKISYSIGVSVLRNFRQQRIDPDLEFVFKGMKDAQSGGKLLMTEEELRSTLDAYQAELKEKYVLAMKALAVENKKKGDDFLASNKTKDGVVTLSSGMQYKILKKGDGKKPSGDDTVECNYMGTLIDGTEFDSSYRTGKPVTFKVSGVIPGFTEALKLMPVGSRWQLFIPPQLAYGERGAGRYIGPNATLIFELEILGIK